jgi:ABC-type sugar transport system substrate-binding protein
MMLNQMGLIRNILLLLSACMILACSTPPAEFRVYQQSDGTIGLHVPKTANDAETHEVAEAECKKLGKRTATLVDSRKTVNDRFPMSYTYLCR